MPRSGPSPRRDPRQHGEPPRAALCAAGCCAPAAVAERRAPRSALRWPGGSATRCTSSGGMPVFGRVGVGLGVDEHEPGQVVRQRAQLQRRAPGRLVDAAARRGRCVWAWLSSCVSTMNSKGCSMASKRAGLALQRAEHLHHRLDRGDAVVGGLGADAVVARAARREADARQARQERIALHDLPAPVATSHRRR